MDYDQAVIEYAKRYLFHQIDWSKGEIVRASINPTTYDIGYCDTCAQEIATLEMSIQFENGYDNITIGDNFGEVVQRLVAITNGE